MAHADRLSTVELLPFTGLDAVCLRDYGRQIFSLVSNPVVQDHLLSDLHLPGVVKRHTTYDDMYGEPGAEASGKRMITSRIKMRKGDFQAYLIRAQVAGEAGRIVGQATIMPDLSLHRQPTPLPRSVTQRLPGVGRQAVDTSELGANVGLWVDPRQPEHHQQVADAYTAVRHAAARTALWTILPSDYAGQSKAYAGPLRDAGFDIVDTGYYDDEEAGRNSPIPAATLYAAHAIIPTPTDD